jgi:hypothetical protein
MDIGRSASVEYEKYRGGRFNDFTVVTVTGVSSPVKILAGESVMRSARRSYGNTLKEEKVIGPLHGGSSERLGVDHRPAACRESSKKWRADARRHGR